MPWFGQELFEMAQAKGSLKDAAYLEARAKARNDARETTACSPRSMQTGSTH